MPIKVTTQDELRKAEEELRIALMKGDYNAEDNARQLLINTVSDGDAPENIRSACSRLLQMKFVENN